MHVHLVTNNLWDMVDIYRIDTVSSPASMSSLMATFYVWPAASQRLESAKSDDFCVFKYALHCNQAYLKFKRSRGLVVVQGWSVIENLFPALLMSDCPLYIEI